jgi:hypothetical protein
MERIAKYIAYNPIKAKMPAQDWPFVLPYNGWVAACAK